MKYQLLSLLPLAISGVVAQSSADRSNYEAEAKITDATAECAPYYYAPTGELLPKYPEIWAAANLSKADADTKHLWYSMRKQIPNIAPRNITGGDPSVATQAYTKNGTDDPDCWWTYSKCTTPKNKDLAEDVYTCPEPKVWGFTLDDGPNCSHNAYFDYLQENGHRATLFYIGSNVLDWPLEAQRGLADGHEICSHTWSHPYMTSLTDEEVFAELYYSKKAIHDVTGVTVRCWRPPYGDVDDRVRWIAAQLDMITVVWDHDTDDWEVTTKGPDQIVKNYDAIINNATSGSLDTHGIVVLTHEIDAQTMNLSQTFLPKMTEAFNYVLPVGVCHNNTRPYVEQDYQYPDFNQWISGVIDFQDSNPSPSPNTSSTLDFPPVAQRMGMKGVSYGGQATSEATPTSSLSPQAASSSAAAAAQEEKTSGASMPQVAVSLSVVAAIVPAIVMLARI